MQYSSFPIALLIISKEQNITDSIATNFMEHFPDSYIFAIFISCFHNGLERAEHAGSNIHESFLRINFLSSETFSPIYQYFYRNDVFLRLKTLQRMYGSLVVCHQAIPQFLIANISINLIRKKLQRLRVTQVHRFS